VFFLAASLSAAPVRIGGRVLGPDGEPAVGARVSLLPAQGVYERGRRLLAGELSATPAATAGTDREGLFSLRAPRPGLYSVRVETTGATPAAAVTPVRAFLEEEELPTVRLLPAGEEGVLAFAAGSPAWIPVEIGEGREVSVPPAREEGARLLVEVRRSQGAGRVAAAEGESPPAPDVLLFLADPFLPLALTGEDGRAELRVPRAGSREILALGPDGESAWVRLDDGGAGSPEPGAGPAPLRLSLRPPRVLAGRVASARAPNPGDVPLPGARVWLAGEPSRIAVSGEGGSFSLAAPRVWLRPGAEDLALDAVAPWHFPRRFPGREVAAREEGATSVPNSPGRSGSPPEGTVLTLLPAARISGVVVDEGGRGVAGAEVRARPSRRDEPSSPRRGKAEVVGRGDGAGRFSLLLPAGEAHVLEAGHRGHAPARLEVPALAALTHREHVRLVLDQGRPAFGFVLDGEEQPVPGALVLLIPTAASVETRTILYDALEGLRAGREGPPYRARTDGDGRFEIPDLPPDRYVLLAEAPGFARAVIPGLEVPAERDGPFPLGTVLLDGSLLLEGRVVDSDGHPIAGAQVQLSAPGSLYEFLLDAFEHQASPPRVASDEDGFFRIPNLRRGEPVQLAVTHAGYLPVRLPGVEAPLEEPLRVVLKAAAILSGRVVDDLGAPVADARLVLTAADGEIPGLPELSRGESRWAISERDGTFRFESALVGRLGLKATAEGFQNRQLLPFELAPGQVREGLEVVLSRGETLSGRVTDEIGNPVVGASLTVVRAEEADFLGRFASPAGSEVRGGASEVDGTWRIGGLSAGEVTLRVRHQDYEELLRTLEIPPGGDVLDLVLRPRAGYEVTGRVVGEDGGGVAGVRLLLHAATGSAAFAPAISEEDGSFQLEGVSPGAYLLWVEPPPGSPSGATGPEWAPGEPTELALTDGPVHGLIVRLYRGRSVRGRLLGLELDELGRVHVSAFHGGIPGREGNVRYDGTYRIDGLAPGTWQINAFLPDGRRAAGEVEVIADSEEVEADLDFAAGHTIRGQVMVGGNPLAGAQVSASAGTGGAWSRTDYRGFFRLTGLETGTCELLILHPERRLQHRRTIVVGGDEEITVELAVGEILGRVVNSEDGLPLPGASVVLSAVIASSADVDAGATAILPVATARTDAAGSFSFAEVLEGSWRLTAHLPGYGVGNTAVVVSPEGPLPEPEIRLTPTGGLTLILTDPSGPVAGPTLVAALGPEPEPVLQGIFPAAADGRLPLAALPAGSWEILVTTSESGTVAVDVTVPGPEVAVFLPPGADLRVEVPELAGAAVAATVTLSSPEGRPFRTLGWRGSVRSAWVLAAGQVHIDRLPPGTWTVRVETTDGRILTATATTVAGETSAVVVE